MSRKYGDLMYRSTSCPPGAAGLGTGTTSSFVGSMCEPGYLSGGKTVATLSPGASENAARYTSALTFATPTAAFVITAPP